MSSKLLNSRLEAQYEAYETILHFEHSTIILYANCGNLQTHRTSITNEVVRRDLNSGST